MKKLFFLGIFFLSPNLFASAVLLEFTGTPKLLQERKEIALQSGIELLDGSTLSTNAQSKAQLMLDSGAIVEIVANQSFRVGDVSAKPKQTGFIEGLQVALNEVKQSGETPTVHGMIKMGNPGTGSKKRPIVSSALFGVAGIYPLHTAIHAPADKLKIEWSPETRVKWDNPVLVVEDAKKKQIYVSAIQSTDTSHELCTCKLKLKAGEKYFWYLGNQTPERVVLKGTRYPFSLLSEKQEKEFKGDLKKITELHLQTEFAKALLTAQVYYKHGLVFDMVETLEPLYNPEQKKTGDKNIARDLLFLGNARMGFVKEADKYR